MSRIATVHDSLRKIDAAAGNVACFIDVYRSEYGAGMDSHTQLQLRL